MSLCVSSPTPSHLKVKVEVQLENCSNRKIHYGLVHDYIVNNFDWFVWNMPSGVFQFYHNSTIYALHLFHNSLTKIVGQNMIEMHNNKEQFILFNYKVGFLLANENIILWVHWYCNCDVNIFTQEGPKLVSYLEAIFSYFEV